VKQGAAVVKGVAGNASYVDELGFARPLVVGAIVKPGQTIKTGFDGAVDLFLGQNGPGVGVKANSILALDSLTTQESVLGALIDTRLNLKQGQLYGIVDKLLPGSHYEVKMPNGVATVRGTEFFIDATSGTVYVTSGTVTVHVVLNLQSPTPGTLSKDVVVNAGQMLSIPTQFKSNGSQSFDNLSASKTPGNLSVTQLRILAQLGALTRYVNGNTTSQVTETFIANKEKNGKIDVTKPPTSIVVSP